MANPRFGEVENVIDTSAAREMSEADRDAFLRRMRNAILGVNRPAGGPSLAPVWYLWDGEAFTISAPQETAKLPLIRRDPEVSLCIDDPMTGTFVTAFGRAVLIEDEPAVTEATWPLLLKYFHPPEAQVRWQRYVAQGNRAVIVVRPERMIWRTGVK